MNHTKRLELADILIGMYNEEKTASYESVDWSALCQDATREIEDNLFHLVNNQQRLGYLCTAFSQFFQHGVGFSLSQIDTEEFDKTDDCSFRYACYCRWTMNWVVYEISRAVTYYEDLSFKEVVARADIPNEFFHEIRVEKDSAVEENGALRQRTKEDYLSYVEFYIAEIKRNNKNKIGATSSTIKAFNISDKTLSRALNEFKIMLDIYNIKK